MVQYEERVATVDELRAIAQAVGWLDHFDWSTMHNSLAASLHGVVAVSGDRVVGTARLVGDGVRYVYVQDVMVDPAHEGEGIATELTQRLVTWAQKSPGAFVGLFASPEAVGVYEDLGFTTDDMTGMHL